jgi:hypothetical protein
MTSTRTADEHVEISASPSTIHRLRVVDNDAHEGARAADLWRERYECSPMPTVESGGPGVWYRLLALALLNAIGGPRGTYVSMKPAATAPPGEEIRMFSLRPALEIRGRKSKGWRAFAGNSLTFPRYWWRSPPC